MVFLVAKLGYTVAKQVTKRLSKALAETANKSKILRTCVVFPLGRLLNRVWVEVKMREIGVSAKVTKLPDMGNEKLTQMGSEIMAEILLVVLFGSFLALAVVFNHGSHSDLEDEHLAEIKRRLKHLDKMMDNQQEALKTLAVNIDLLSKLEDEQGIVLSF